MKKVLFVGGGTLGPVTPLLAVYEAWKAREEHLVAVWVGTKQGPERAFVEKEGIPFFSLPQARLVRYPSKEWGMTPFRFLGACLKSYMILRTEKPDVIAAAGGYTSVPIVLVGRMMGIPSWIHQSDVKPILTNRLLAPFATWITVAFEKTARAFPKSKTIVVGNPVREKMKQGIKARAVLMFGCNESLPTVFVFGGGTGATWINRFVEEQIDDLRKIANVIHVTGKGKAAHIHHAHTDAGEHMGSYFVVETMADEMADAYSVSDVVVSRAGTGALSELAALKKTSIIIPLPDSPQEENARSVRDGAVILEQSVSTSRDVFNQVRRLLNDPLKRLALGQRLGFVLETDCAGKIVDILEGC